MDIEDEDFPVRPVTLSEAKEMLEEERETRGELTYEQRLAFEQAQNFVRLEPDDARDLVEELVELDRVTVEHAIKIADMAPLHEEDVKAVFQDDRYTPDDDQTDTIMGLVRDYLY